jgi:vitamin K-dependent gamma-carboxylase
MAVGLVMALEAYSLCRPNPAAISSGTSPLETYYIGQAGNFHFPYSGFGWLPTFPTPVIYTLVWVQAVTALLLMVGFFYRTSATLLFLSYGYFFMIESTRTYWQSHYYLELLVTFLLIWMPAARVYSLDAYFSRSESQPRTIPFWPVFLLRAQLVIAYFYAGVAKINLDWLIDAVPVRWFLREAHVTAPYRRFFSPSHFEVFEQFIHSPGLAYFLSYTGLLFDLCIGFLFLFRRTRIFAFLLMLIFHATNHFLIFDDISWFPLLGLGTALIFLDTDWPERFGRWALHPHLTAPDYRWLLPGAIVFPIVGAALGWRLKPTSALKKVLPPFQLNRWVPRFVFLWLLWQGLFPLRHYFIAGDGRFTYEGLSFSWRLKTDVHHAYGAQIFVSDQAIISSGESGQSRINWNNWHGEKVVYYQIAPEKINWNELPEICVILEPMLGERIIYNSFADTAARIEAEARQRISELWRRYYGREPSLVAKSLPLSSVLESIAGGLKQGGGMEEAAAASLLAEKSKSIEQGSFPAEQLDLVRKNLEKFIATLKMRDPAGSITSYLRRSNPFSAAAESTNSFLVIDDPSLFQSQPGRLTQVNRALWQPAMVESDPRFNGALLVVTGDIGFNSREMLPKASIFFGHWGRPIPSARIVWNSSQDINASKFTHISNQAFYLRRYARRVAGLWESECGRRPAVHALTAVSMNGRPHQPLIDPSVDLAAVNVSWFRHNTWINDLQTRRVPPSSINNGAEFLGN